MRTPAHTPTPRTRHGLSRHPHSLESPTPASIRHDGLRELDVRWLPDHRDRLFRAAYALCRSREDAEDLVQETFERVLRRPRFLRHDDDLGYLLRVLRNTWINAYKARQRRPQTVELDETVEFMIDRGADPSVTVGELESVYAAVAELPMALRETLVAVDIVGLSYRQASDALGIKQGTTMSRLYRARNAVAERLEQSGVHPPSRAG
jgi:RNA polymerase sigma-70 factor (ECF subfamily)